VNTRASQIVELRFFGGFTVDETAEALGVSVRTVINDWNAARAWLFHELSTNVEATRRAGQSRPHVAPSAPSE
jgi:DNA-directed RNA polymerase specialized sigma24 family protein